MCHHVQYNCPRVFSSTRINMTTVSKSNLIKRQRNTITNFYTTATNNDKTVESNTIAPFQHILQHDQHTVAAKSSSQLLPQQSVHNNNTFPVRLPPNTIPLVNKQTTLSFVPVSSSSSPSMKWYVHNNSIIYTVHPQSQPNNKLACFDLDNTLIMVKSNNKYPKDQYDYKFVYNNQLIETQLRELYHSGYRIIIFTNQWGIGLGKQNKFHITNKISDIISKLNIPVDCYAAIQDDMNRKGNSGMYQFMLQYYNGPYNSIDSIDRSHSFYVGDAAGRQRGWDLNAVYRYDKHCSDRKFAYYCQLQFYTPEEYFLRHAAAPFDWNIDIPYSEIPQHKLSKDVLDRLRYNNGIEMVILVGIQGAGMLINHIVILRIT